ncbi:ASCH domain-containing protein [Actinomycetaceae bacterium TAE3-ERU4]|nr:ASCH domain-containing protein [Actinomycetaceae bacterium TAE3-ERU4]
MDNQNTDNKSIPSEDAAVSTQHFEDSSLAEIKLNDAELETFWQLSRKHIGAERLSVILGPDEIAITRPEAFTFTFHPETADSLAQLVIEGKKTSTSSLKSEYEQYNEPLPQAGDLSIVCNSHGSPVALLYTEEVVVFPFNEVPAEHAFAEGEGDRSLSYWRAIHRAFWSSYECDWKGDGTDLVVYEKFRVIYPEK